MKKLVIALVLAVMVLTAFSSVVYAGGHEVCEVKNVPAVAAKHGFCVTGQQWGAIVSSIASSMPAAIPLAHGRGPSK